MSYLIKFLQTLDPKFKHCLPYFHNCTFTEAVEYAEHGIITGKECDVFEPEELVYLFLGKGRYVAKYKDGSLKYTPISFILKPDANFEIERIYPFDTGACKAGKYEKILMAEDMEDVKERFLMGKDIAIAYLLISFFYNSLEDYVNDVSINYPEEEIYAEAIKTGATQLEEINELYRTRFVDADGRKVAIEVQVAGDLNLAENTGYLAIPSKNFSTNTYFADFCTKNNVKPKIYAESQKLSADLLYGKLVEGAREVALDYLASCN